MSFLQLIKQHLLLLLKSLNCPIMKSWIVIYILYLLGIFIHCWIVVHSWIIHILLLCSNALAFNINKWILICFQHVLSILHYLKFMFLSSLFRIQHAISINHELSISWFSNIHRSVVSLMIKIISILLFCILLIVSKIKELISSCWLFCMHVVHKRFLF